MENKKNSLTIVLIVIIAILCLVVGILIGDKFLGSKEDIKNDIPTEEKNDADNPTKDGNVEEEQNIDVETAFNNFVINNNLSVNENVYDKDGLNNINCTSAKLASGNGYSLEIYKFNSEDSAKKYYSDQNNYKLDVSNVKQLISSGNDYYEAILTPNLEESPNAIGNEVDYIYQLRIDNFYIVLFETSTNSDKTNIINIAKQLKTDLNIN